MNIIYIASQLFYERCHVAQIIHRIAAQLRRQVRDFSSVTPIPHARVPIVKGSAAIAGTSKPTHVEFDICINNTLALHNTLLLRTYAQLDPRVRQLALLVKHWAKCRQVNTARDGTLSSYCK